MTSEPTARSGRLTPEIVWYHARSRATHNYVAKRRVTTYGHAFRKQCSHVDCREPDDLCSFCFAHLMQDVQEWLDALPTANKAKRNSGRDSLSTDWEFRVRYACEQSISCTRVTRTTLNKMRGNKASTCRRFVRLASRSVSVTTTITHRRYRVVHTLGKWRFRNISAWSNRISLYYSPQWMSEG